MGKSVSYYLTVFVLKLKGIKKEFSKSPIDYKKLRKDDIYTPKGSFFNSSLTSVFNIAETKITEIRKNETSEKLLIFVHGGAFVFGPSAHHWDTIKTLSKNTDFNVWMCDYPKAPENKIDNISHNIYQVFQKAKTLYKPENITFIGDSAGATLILLLVQDLIKKQETLPSKLILISPVLDASLDNPDVDFYDAKDPMLSKKGVVSAKEMCSKDGNLKSESISPLFGHFEGFPNTSLFFAEYDVAFPDQLLFLEKLKAANIDYSVEIGKGMPHIWPFLPVMAEAKTALKKIIDDLNR